MSAKQLLINLFSLPQQEIIFQDYGCALKQLITKYGRIFLSENHYCFYANIAGIKTNLVINIDKVQSLEMKSKSDIQVLLKDGKIHCFSSFNDRDSVYQLMNALFTGTPAQFTSEVPIGVDEKVMEKSGEKSIIDAEVEVSFLTPEIKENTALELMKVVLPVTVEKFFEYFLADDAQVYSLLDHRMSVGDTETNISKWQEESSGIQREMKTVIKLKDVPFKDKSRMHKIQSYKKEGTSLTICSTTNTLDVPYANHFQAEERWEVTELEGDTNKCVLRCFGWVVFLKSTYMKKIINSRSMQGYKEDYEIWVNNVKKRLEALSVKQLPIRESQKSDSHEYEDSNMRTNQVKKSIDHVPLNPKLKGSKRYNIQVTNLAITLIIGIILLFLVIILLKLNQMNNHLISIESRLFHNAQQNFTQSTKLEDL